MIEELSMLQVFVVADDEWWVAESAAEARAGFMKLCGFKDPGDEDYVYPLEEVAPLSDERLDQLVYQDDLDDADSPRRTFREEIERRKQAGEWEPGYFATGNY